jgi:hypothetical protein
MFGGTAREHAEQRDVARCDPVERDLAGVSPERDI